MWSQIGIAMLAGVAAAAASQAYTTNHYSGVLRTPHGTYAWASSYRDNSIGVLGATAAVAGGTAGIVGVQNRLDYTLENLATEIIQTTTIDPDGSYGGRVVIEKDDKAKLPYDVKINMSFGGVDYPFVFRVTKEGVNLPPPYTMPMAATSSEAPSSPSVAQQPGSAAVPLAPASPAVATPAPIAPTS